MPDLPRVELLEIAHRLGNVMGMFALVTQLLDEDAPASGFKRECLDLLESGTGQLGEIQKKLKEIAEA